MNRSQMRELTFQLLYQIEIQKEINEETIDIFCENNQIDEDYPATLSQKTINGLLRNQLGWNGIVVTDDMHMKAISDNYSLEESLQLTINAGADMIILSSNIPGNTEHISQQAIDLIVKSVREGKIKESRIDEAVARIDNLLKQ